MSGLTKEQRTAGVAALLNPTNIAIVGASDRPGSWSGGVKRALTRAGFAGKVFPVNPRNATVWGGETCYPSLADLPERPDHVVVLVPGKAAIDTIREAGKSGARSATVFSSGFGEGGDSQGRALGEMLRHAIADAGLAVSGPNCNGNLAAPGRLLTIPDDRIRALTRGPAAVVGQSGGIIMALYRTLASRAIAVSYALTSGNELGLTTADYIRYLVDDPDIKVIGCFIEAIRNGDDFQSACEYARRAAKPIVAVKIGGSAESQKAALAHTGSLAGSLACFDAVAETLGLIRVNTLDDMIEAIDYFAHAAPPRGPRLGALTFSGGLKGLMLESATRNGLEFPPLRAETTARLASVLGVGTSLGNPLDGGFTALSSAENYFRIIDILLDDPGIDALLVQEELPAAAGTNAKTENLRQVDARAKAGAKPIAVVSMISYGLTDHSRGFRAELKHLPVLQEVDKALKAVAAAGRYGALQGRDREMPSPPASQKERAAIATALAQGRAAGDGRTVLDEAQAKALLRTYGIRTPRELAAGSEGEAVRAAQEIGYPLVLKILAAEVQHKSDIGGVVVGIKNDTELRAAHARIGESFSRARGGARLAQVLVAEQISGGIELVLGVQRDPEVGPVLMFGAGGVLLELSRDIAFGAIPLSCWQAEAMLARTSVGTLLKGYRGGEPADRESVLAAMLALSRLAHDLGDAVESIDINPFVALPAGRDAVALDALVVLRK
ncbi:MAG TPA: acetate--CoA ligase family protein [Xanthobacteraceae bacterium]|nr:acetate--CoA ligase family protein [Xanthobacteraceae bacterium]